MEKFNSLKSEWSSDVRSIFVPFCERIENMDREFCGEVEKGAYTHCYSLDDLDDMINGLIEDLEDMKHELLMLDEPSFEEEEEEEEEF